MTRLIGAFILLTLAGIMNPGRAMALEFFGEKRAFQQGSMLAFSSSLNSQNIVSSSPAGQNNDQNRAKAQEGAIVLDLAYFKVGLAGEKTRSSNLSTGLFQTNDRTFGTGFAALVFHGLFSEGIDFAIVGSRNSVYDKFFYNGFQREERSRVESQTGVLLRLWFVFLGFVKGRNLTELTISDPGRPLILEEYPFDFEARVVGLGFGEEGEFRFGITVFRKDIPMVPGNVVDQGEGFEKNRSVILQFHSLTLSGSENLTRKSYIGEILSETEETEISLAWTVGDGLEFNLSSTRILATDQFIQFNNPTVVTTDTRIDSVGFTLNF